MATSFSRDRNAEDLQSIQRQIHEKKNGILESAQRIQGLVHESEAIGISTTDELVDQGERLKKIEKDLDSIDGTLISVRKKMNKLGSIFGGIKNLVKPPKSAFHESGSQPQISDANKKKSTPATTVTTRSTNPKYDNDTYLGKSRSDMDDIELETEKVLDDVSDSVTRLRILALRMNEELENQNVLAERLAGKMDRLNQTVIEKNKELKKIALK